MANRWLMVLVCAVVACKGKGDKPAAGSGSTGAGSAPESGSGALVASGSADRSPLGSAVAGSGAGSAGSASASGSGDDRVELPATVKGTGWSFSAGFGDAQNLFDASADDVDKLAVELSDAADQPVWRVTGFAAIAGVGAPRPTGCEELRVTPVIETWGEASGVRLSVLCVNGEDFKTAAETAILLEIKGPARDQVARLWAGAADVATSEMDACLRTTEIKFSVKGATLAQDILDEVARSGGGGAKDCKPTKKKKHVETAFARATL